MKKMLMVLLLIPLLVSFTVAQTWEILTDGGESPFIDKVDFIDANVGYMSADDIIMKTTDGGLTWVELDTLLNCTDLDFVDANTGYVACKAGFIYKTTDGGDSWTMVGDTANIKGDYKCVYALDANNAFFGGYAGFFAKTNDGGATFYKADFTFDTKNIDDIAFVSVTNGVAVNLQTGANTFYTTDGGVNWTKVSIAAQWPSTLQYTKLYAVDATGTNTFIVGGYNYVKFKSTDGGQTYTQMGNVQYGFPIVDEMFAIDENTYYSTGSDGFVEKTTDGGATWTVISIPAGQNIYSSSFPTADAGYVMAYYYQWYKTLDGGNSWSRLSDWPSISFWGVDSPAEGKIVAGGVFGGEITTTLDGGITWTYPDNTLTGSVESFYEVIFVDENTGFLAGTGGEIYKTTDGGVTYTLLENSFWITGATINAMAAIGPDTLFIAGASAAFSYSYDGGTNWTDFDFGSKTIYSIYPLSSDKVLLGASTGYWWIYEISTATLTEGIFGGGNMREIAIQNGVCIVASKPNIYRTTLADIDSLGSVYETTNTATDEFYSIEFVTDDLVYVVGEGGIVLKSEDAGLTWTEDYIFENGANLQGSVYRDGILWVVGQNGMIAKLDFNPPQMTIGEAITDTDADFVPDLLGETVTITGVVTTPSYTSGMSYGVQDATGGIYLYASSALTTLNIGDEVKVTGAIAQYKGLTEISLASADDIVVLATGSAYDTLEIVPANLDESVESQLILMKNVWLVEGQTWPAEGSYKNLNITDGMDTVIMRIDNDTDIDGWATPPSGNFNVVGLASQYTSASPANDGYQIIPRFQTDIVDIPDPVPVTFEVNMSVYIIDSKFNPTSDYVDIAGTFNNWGANDVLDDSDGDSIYSITLEGFIPGETIQFKFRINGSWNDATCELPYGAAAREYVVLESGNTYSAYYNNDTTPEAIDPEAVPTVYALRQNYPNPFNPTTNISFDLPEDADVNLVVFNMVGQQVAVLKNGAMQAGTYNIHFDASRLASGVYFYRIQANDFSSLKKMIIMK